METDRLAKHMLFKDDIPASYLQILFSVERDCYVIGSDCG